MSMCISALVYYPLHCKKSSTLEFIHKPIQLYVVPRSIPSTSEGSVLYDRQERLGVPSMRLRVTFLPYAITIY
ncbi:hypothetical protein M951_chr375 (nucleomorph) [Lotharella oceanica]|uniref:Uncharacterized protein n=1 Tax=Lotharella oceanica TaxID=641309 RepID=A0A060DBW0_9EUKA|nr:hypothetical protein M951_chr375 [Lotharella oceanica]